MPDASTTERNAPHRPAPERTAPRRPMLLRLGEDLHDDLAALAAAHDEPVSVVTRRALRAGLTVLHAQHLAAPSVRRAA